MSLRRLGGALLLGLPALGWACGAALPAAHRVLVSGPSGAPVLAFATTPTPIPVGRHFRLEIELCAAGGERATTELKVDADMPAHQHGMNYRTVVRGMGPGRFEVEGMMFHMPGRWRMVFDLRGPEGTQRLTYALQVP